MEAVGIPPLEDHNAWADFWYYHRGANVIPANTMQKKIFIKWKPYETASIPEEQHNQWKKENTFRDGMAIILGQVWRGEHIGEHLIFIDLDNQKAIEEFCNYFKDSNGNPATLQQIAEKFIVEQHEDDPTKAHVFFYSENMFPKKSSDVKAVGQKDDQIPALEIKGSGLHGIAYCTPSFHKNGHRYKIIGTTNPVKLSEDQAQNLIEHIDDSICRKHGLHYLEWEDGSGNAQVPITELFKEDYVVYENHNRHGALLRVIESLIKRNYGILQPADIRRLAYEWNQKHCQPPLDDKEFEKQWRDGAKWILPKIKEEERKEQEQQKPVIEATEELTKEVSWDDIAAVLDISIKKDRSAKLITFDNMLLAQTNEDQLNVGFQAESSAGKSYVPLEVSQYFPEKEVDIIASASPTALYHDSANSTWDKEKKQQILDLEHKILIFLDMPNYQLLEKLRPLLSHDKKELHYKITDKSKTQGLRTKNVTIRGYPSIFFCSVKHDMDEQEKTRLTLLSPTVDQGKLKESLKLAALRKGDPAKYRKLLAENKDRKGLMDRICLIRVGGVREIVIPDYDKAYDRFISEHEYLLPRHQRDFPRIMSFIKAHALLNFFKREHDPSNNETIFANDADVEAGFRLYKEIEASNELGLSPYVYDIYQDIIKPALAGVIEGINDGLSREDINKKYFQARHKTLSNERLKSILMQLEAVGLIRQEPDPKDRRKMVVYPPHAIDIPPPKKNEESEVNGS